jgi:nicotinamide-nucleotide amidase
MNAEIIAIGTELLLGFTVNTDTAFLGRALAGLGIDCTTQVTVGDNPARLAQAIRTALSRADLVITCGGLGPTVDDITLETIASLTGKRLIRNRQILNRIQRRFARIGVRMPTSNLRQAMIPEGAVLFPNEVGTAPGFLLRGQTPFAKNFSKRNSKRGLTPLLVALPGPPAELIPMVEKHLIPLLRRYTGKTVIRSI